MSRDCLDNKALKEIHFHLKEMRRDFKTLSRDIEILSKKEIRTLYSIVNARNQTLSIASEVEHNANHHFADFLRLVGNQLNQFELLKISDRLKKIEFEYLLCKIDWKDQEIEDMTLNIMDKIQDIGVKTRLASSLLEEIASGVKHLDLRAAIVVESSKELAKLCLEEICPDAEMLCIKAHQLHRKASPSAAREEDYWDEIAIPLYLENHIHARSLEFCPRCGSILTEEDRTFDGSYCESCRTHWGVS